MDIIKSLYEMQDIAYRDFQSGLIPTVPKEAFIGIRTPLLRDFAKKITGTDEANQFLCELPHTYFDENQLHAFIISREKDFYTCIDKVNSFLPYIDNWATCDQLSPAVFKKHKQELLQQIDVWLKSDHTYTVRFGIGMLMQHYLDDDFKPEYLEKVSAIRSEEYYINMEIAWYFATALAKQYDSTIPYIEKKKLDKWTHNKSIQKARESRRVSQEEKDYLKSLKQ